MAAKRYRILTEQFWTDVKVEEMSFEEKAMFAYLVTNPYTNGCGCYEVTLRQIAAQTSLTVQKVQTLIKALQDKYKVIRYYDSTCEMLIYKFGRYNWSNSPKLLQGAMNDAAGIKNPEAAEFVRNAIERGVDGKFEPPAHEPSTRTQDAEQIASTDEPKAKQQAERKRQQVPEPPAAVEAIVLNDGTEWRPTESQYEEFMRLFPSVDVAAEFRGMRAWSQGNPSKRKTKGGVMRFVTSWLGRTQNQPKSVPQARKGWQVEKTTAYNVDDLERQLLAN